jgi:hypothetical protein
VWDGGPQWVALDASSAEGGAPVRWASARSGILTIDPANYWDGIQESDAMCYSGWDPHVRAQYGLTVDAASGAILRYEASPYCAGEACGF